VQLEDSEKAFDAGMNDFITKPVQLKELEEVLHKAENEIGKFLE
jgi:CheY-like chemotaxis protein